MPRLSAIVWLTVVSGWLLCGCGDSSPGSDELCGNGVVDPGEFCDGADLGGRSCSDLGYLGGMLGCNSECNYDYSLCSSDLLCGNGAVDDGEECDGSNLDGKSCADFGFDSGSLSCDSACQLDTSGCSTAALCGNQALDPGEECDGTDLDGKSCIDLGLVDGVLVCNADCEFDSSGCLACGNGVIDDPEECDGADLNNLACTDLGYAGGELACSDSCLLDTTACESCGNDIVDDGEECDGSDLNDTACTDLDYAGGDLACTDACVFDTDTCLSCGNGNVDAGEECDGQALGGEDCISLGYVGGDLSCSAGCSLDDSACLKCGNGVIDGDEECDGTDLGNTTCEDLAFTGGPLACTDSCSFDTDGCFWCGNGVLEDGEECDGTDLGGEDCVSLGYSGGDLACTGECLYNEDGCSDCTAPDAFQPWIQTYLQEVLASLTGESEIAPGETISARSSSYQRGLVRGYLSDEFAAYGLEPFLHEYSGSGANVFGVLPATNGSTEWVVFGGHFDSISTSPGADDNGTGTTVTAAVARYAAMLPCRSKNLMFVGFDQEESGLIGSYQFADWLDTEGYDVHSAHTADMVGWDGDDDRMVEIELPDGGLFDLYDSVVTQSGLGVGLRQTSAGGTDHVSFRQFGFDAVGLCEEWTGGDSTPYYHSSSDRFDTIDFDYLELVTILANLAVAELTKVP